MKSINRDNIVININTKRNSEEAIENSSFSGTKVNGEAYEVCEVGKASINLNGSHVFQGISIMKDKIKDELFLKLPVIKYKNEKTNSITNVKPFSFRKETAQILKNAILQDFEKASNEYSKDPIQKTNQGVHFNIKMNKVNGHDYCSSTLFFSDIILVQGVALKYENNEPQLITPYCLTKETEIDENNNVVNKKFEFYKTDSFTKDFLIKALEEKRDKLIAAANAQAVENTQVESSEFEILPNEEQLDELFGEAIDLG